MKKMRIFSLAIVMAILCFCTMQVSFADEVITTPEGEPCYYDSASGMTYTYDSTNKTAATYIYGTFDGTKWTYSTSTAPVVIPATIDVGGETYSVTKIGEYTFAAAANKRGNTSAITNTKVSSITMSEGLLEIEPFAFYSCRGNIDEIQIPSTVTTLGANAFTNSNKIEKIIFKGNNITEIPDSCFFKCEALLSLEFPESVKVINMAALRNTFKLATVKIRSENVTFIGSFPVACGISPSDIADGGSGKVATIFYVKNESVKSALQATATEKPVSSNKTYDTSGIKDGSQVLYYFDPTTINNVTYSMYNNGNEAIITGNTFEAGSNSNVVIPETIKINGRDITVKAVGVQAFCYLDANNEPARNGKTIARIELPETVTSIGKQAFYQLNTMKSFVAKGNIVLTAEDAGILMGCSSLVEIDFKSINMLTNKMFDFCQSLEKIVIPSGESITISETAFDRVKVLTDIYLNASQVVICIDDTKGVDKKYAITNDTIYFHVPTSDAKAALIAYDTGDETLKIDDANVIVGKKLYLMDNLLGTYAVAAQPMDEGKIIVATFEDSALKQVDEIKDVDFNVGYNKIDTSLEKTKDIERKIFVWKDLSTITPLGMMIK